MNRVFALATTYSLLFFLCLSTHQLQAANYAIENSHTSVVFGISHLGYSYTYGRFNQVKGNFQWDNANPAAGKIVFVINTASIDTNDKKRDDHLRGPDFFNAVQYPQIAFQSTSIQQSASDPSGKSFDVSGQLTMHGVTRNVTLKNMKKLGEGQGPYGKYRSGFFWQDSIKRSDFGMTNMIPKIGDEVAITISFEGILQAGNGSGSAERPADSGSVTKPAVSGASPSAGSSGSR